MSEGIWINVFMVFCGMWFALIFVGIGALIGYERGYKKAVCNPSGDVDNNGNGNDARKCVCMDEGSNKGESLRNPCVWDSFCMRCRNGHDDIARKGDRASCNQTRTFDTVDKTYNPNKDEMNTVLEYFMLGGTSYERKVLWAIKERVGADEN